MHRRRAPARGTRCLHVRAGHRGPYTGEAKVAPPRSAAPPAHPRRWLVLVVIAKAQLLIALDVTIANISLPTIQRALGVSDARQWAVTAYSLTFGGFLLLGGRIADFAGGRRAFIAGLLGFAVTSALGAAAVDSGMLFAARARQGALGP